MRSNDKFVQSLVDSIGRKDMIEIALKAAVTSEILKCRYEKHMSQKEFAEFMGVSQAIVSKWESGETNFTIEKIAQICDKLGLIPELEIRKEQDYLSTMSNQWDNNCLSFNDWLRDAA